MKKWICLLLTLLTALLPALAVADAQFDALCTLLAQAVACPDQVYALYGQALDTVDAVAAGSQTVADALPALKAASAGLRAVTPATLAPSDALAQYMLARGISMEDFQAVGAGAVLVAGYYADTVDAYVTAWQQTPELPVQDAAFERARVDFERQMDFVAANTLLLPADEAERETIVRLVVEPTAYLKAAALPWESDMELLFAKYDALEAAYSEMLAKANVDQAAQEAEADTATP